MRPLLPLSLEGKGTHAVEGLPSYLTRLAAAHGVTVGGLFRHLLSEYPSGAPTAAALAAQSLATSVRPNATTERAIAVLAAGGCESKTALEQATFVYLAAALARSPRSFSKHVRWCPACLHEQEIATGTPYLKLSWFLEDVKSCEIHRLVLRDTCPHCLRRPPNGRWWPTFAECSRCADRLDRVQASDRVEHDSEAYAPDLVSLVEDIANRSEPYPAGAANRYVDEIFEHAWANETEDALWEMLPRDECLRYASPEEAITLPVARRIAFRLETPLVELLSGSRPVIQSFGFAYSAPLPQTMTPGRRQRTAGKKILRQRLEAAIEGQPTPESLKGVARRIEVSVGAIRYHCPDLADLIVRRKAAFQQAAIAQKRLLAKAAVKKTIREWPPTGLPMTKKALLRHLFPAAGLPKNLIRAEIQAQWGSQHLQ